MPQPELCWLSEAIGTVLCRQCKGINRVRYPAAVDVCVQSVPSHMTTGLVFRTGISLIHVSLLQVLRPYLQDFVLGRCLNAKGQVIEEYFTCYSKSYIVRRGGKGSRYRICPECGTISSQPDRYPPYVLRRELQEGQSVYQHGGCFLHVTEELAARIDWRGWRNVMLEKVEVRDVPIDGQRLPGDPDWDALKETPREADEMIVAVNPDAPRPGGKTRSRHRGVSAALAGALVPTPATSIPAEGIGEVTRRLWPAEAGLWCSNNSDRSDTREYFVPTRTLRPSPAEPADLALLGGQLATVPGVRDFLYLYSQHDGLGLFSTLGEGYPSIAVLPIREWGETRDRMFESFFDGVEAAFEGLPYKPDDVLPFAALCHGPDRWFVVRTGLHAGRIYFWDHEQGIMPDAPFAASLADFIKILTSEGVPDYFGGIIRFDTRHAAEPKPPPETELFPVRYQIMQL